MTTLDNSHWNSLLDNFGPYIVSAAVDQLTMWKLLRSAEVSKFPTNVFTQSFLPLWVSLCGNARSSSSRWRFGSAGLSFSAGSSSETTDGWKISLQWISYELMIRWTEMSLHMKSMNWRIYNAGANFVGRMSRFVLDASSKSTRKTGETLYGDKRK